MEKSNTVSSNNTNKLSPQELDGFLHILKAGSNNTNKLSPQEHVVNSFFHFLVQIIQINLVLKNDFSHLFFLQVFK